MAGEESKGPKDAEKDKEDSAPDEGSNDNIKHRSKMEKFDRREFLKMFGVGIFAGAAAGIGLTRYDKFGRLTPTGLATNNVNTEYRNIAATGCRESGGGGSGGSGGSGGDFDSSAEPTPSADEFSGTTHTNDTRSSLLAAQEASFLIKNIGFDQNNANGVNCAVTSEDGVGYIDGCYFDGNGGETQGIWVNPRQHVGTLIIRNCYFTNWGDNPIYAETAPPHGAGGKIIVENCYFNNNTRGCVRVSGGAEIYGVQVENTGSLPNNYAEVALFTFYSGRGEVIAEDCDIDLPNGQAVRVLNENPAPQWTVRNSEIRGSISDPGNNVTMENNGSSPNVQVPDAVPESPSEASNG